MRKLLLIAAAIGAGFYFFDPVNGARRRNTAMDRFSSSLGSGSRFTGSAVSSVANQAQGVVRETVSRQPDNPDPDDNTLRDRVETELFGDPSIPKGDLNVFVVGGVVDLRGELPSQTMIDTVIQRAQNVEHVRGVRSYLHLPNTPAPNKEEAIEASEQTT